eukprot:scaffold741_cov336-Pavlova_lutheri.AAC.71
MNAKRTGPIEGKRYNISPHGVPPALAPPTTMKPARSLDGDWVKSGVHQAIQEIIFQSNLRSVGGAMARTKG